MSPSWDYSRGDILLAGKGKGLTSLQGLRSHNHSVTFHPTYGKPRLLIGDKEVMEWNDAGHGSAGCELIVSDAKAWLNFGGWGHSFTSARAVGPNTAFLLVQDDGSLTLNDASGSLWSSQTSDPIIPLTSFEPKNVVYGTVNAAPTGTSSA